MHALRPVWRWREEYDWRSWAARLNQYPRFTTTIDGQNGLDYRRARGRRIETSPQSAGWL